MTRSFRPFTPPWALTCFAHASAAMEMDPQAAAGPESGALMARRSVQMLVQEMAQSGLDLVVEPVVRLRPKAAWTPSKQPEVER